MRTRSVPVAMAAAFLSWSAWACGPAAPHEGPGETDRQLPAAPGELFGDLEGRLLDGSALEMDFDITAEGAAVIEVRGRLDIAADGTLHLEADGSFGGQPVALVLEAGPDSMRFGSAAAPLSAPRPPALREAVVVGLTRMGLLHNIARLTGDAPPDHGEGGVGEWVEVGGFAEAGMEGAARSVAFDITVAGVPAGSATLGLTAGGEPVERRQTVAFPTGEMRVVERYRVGAPGG